MRFGSGGRAALVAVAVVVAGCGGGAPASPQTGPAARSVAPVRVAVSPAQGTKHTRFAVTIVTRAATGVVGRARRSYRADAWAIDPRSGCVNHRDRAFAPAARAGARVAAGLDPRDGEGGDRGWCPGLFRGTVTYLEGFACPATGVCRPPRGFPRRAGIVARFVFAVRC